MNNQKGHEKREGRRKKINAKNENITHSHTKIRNNFFICFAYCYVKISIK